MTSNPFTDLAEKIDGLPQRIVAAIVKALDKHAAAPAAPAWEPIALAVKRRKKARKTLLAAVERGEVARKTVPAPGGEQHLLCIADLDRLYPARS